MKTVVLIILLKLAEGRIKINIETNSERDVEVKYSGFEKNIITENDMALFDIDNNSLKKAVVGLLHAKPDNVYLKSPTPWGDLYKKYNWEQVSTILQVKSAKLRSNHIKTTEILSQNFENPSSNNIKVTAGVTHTVENTVTNSWTSSRDFTFSQEIEYDLNIIVAKISGTTGISVSKSWGKSWEKSETVAIGTSSGVEIELKPGQAATAVLSGTRQTLEVDIEYAVTLRGNLAVNYKKKHNDHHFYGPSINSVLKSGGIKREVIKKETIRVGVYVDSSLKVFDKVTGLPL